MLRLKKKLDQDKGISPAGENEAASPVDVSRRQPGELRIQKEFEGIDLPPRAKLLFPDPDNMMLFHITLNPDDGFWKNRPTVFQLQFPSNYPHDPPKAKCLSYIFHPNVDDKGGVCLNILREDWKPVFSANTVIYGLYHLLLSPGLSDPLNHEAARLLAEKPNYFRQRALEEAEKNKHGELKFTS